MSKIPFDLSIPFSFSDKYDGSMIKEKLNFKKVFFLYAYLWFKNAGTLTVASIDEVSAFFESISDRDVIEYLLDSMKNLPVCQSMVVVNDDLIVCDITNIVIESNPWSPYSGYREYIKSPLWQLLRVDVIKRDNGICQKCGETGNHVHHTTYELGAKENGDNLILLCKSCHGVEHGKK